MMENFFVSPVFALVCIGGLIIYYIPFFHRIQIPLLVAVSLFILWLASGKMVFLMLFSAITTSIFSYASSYGRPERRKLYMISGVAINLSLLIFFKYKRLLMPEPVFAGWFGADSTWRDIYGLALPIGISFYVFHGISLIIDSHRSPETLANSGRHFLAHSMKTVLYISFFPQIVAGPIAKGKYFYPQISIKRFQDIKWVSALRALAHGYFMKEVIANNLNQLTAPMVRPLLWPQTASSEMALMTVSYSAQIFADFAGYSLIAIGLGRLFGYELPINFNQPYFADSFTDFWRRWHISLSSWLRDYLYIPLGGNRKGDYRTYLNLMIVMFLGGLWHGPEWKYATWGLAHAVALAVERLIERGRRQTDLPRPMLLKIARILFVFSYVSLAWLFFRLNSVSEVIAYLGFIFAWKDVSTTFHSLNMMLLWLFCGLVLIQHTIGELSVNHRIAWIERFDPVFTGFLIGMSIVARGKTSAFIYFQF
jgi:alginate O-acetyltransferase complex protein AlgI